MLRILRLLAAGSGLLLIVLFAIGNRAPVDVAFWPTPLVVDLPLYGVFLMGLLLGALVTAAIAGFELLRLRLDYRRLARRLHGYEYQARLREAAAEDAALERIRAAGRKGLPSAAGS
ncbi:hypothetical protein HRbin40_00425 [bacterium HR40]|nr:hypothetical protein HRbin40_00425 [bacterium HR40]